MTTTVNAKPTDDLVTIRRMQAVLRLRASLARFEEVCTREDPDNEPSPSQNGEGARRVG